MSWSVYLIVDETLKYSLYARIFLAGKKVMQIALGRDVHPLLLNPRATTHRATSPPPPPAATAPTTRTS
uniref:Ribosome assembly factor mrt4 n=1 Tax=Oryza glumipatula TaxID=40148 RepID=A0A0E0BEF2_9ORYZ